MNIFQRFTKMSCLRLIKFSFAGSVGLLLSLLPLQTYGQYLSPLDSKIIKLSSILWSDIKDIKFHQSKTFCVFFDGLTVADLSDINSPSQIGQVELTPNSSKVAIWGNHAYVIAKDSTIYLVDISSVNQPVLVNNFKLPDLPTDIQVGDNCAYVATKTTGC